ncbi:unnamed protein product [Vitrella brassicaformis CCMP3155]|uniref:Uncharacterized protein n=1 Tax=Vitrella brassicaformis (strain CCMP3155) TaxID=1169540 RepID=A0A0G4ERD2_VITBC|nr:unnamed protein product [Vitrella brassicaformis CCMP3155]|eukprot:CEL99989.1 unnamed protein product [Vitrella brassicaformis CCMP3155]
MLFFLGISLPLVISAAGKIFINRTSAEHIIVPGRAATDSDARRAVVSTVYAQEPDDGNSKKKKYKPTRKVKFVPVGPNAGTYCDPYTRHYYPNLCPTPEQQQGEIPKAEWDPKSFPSSAGPTAYPGGPQITGLEHLRHGDMEEHMRSIKTKWLGPGLGQIFMSNLVESSMDLLNPKGAGGLLSSVTSGLVGAVAKGVGLESGKMVDAFVDNAGSFGGFVFNQLLSSLDPDNLLPAIGGGNIRDRLGSLFDSFFGPLDSEGNYDSLRERGVQVMMALMQKGAQAGVKALNDREGLTKSIKGVAGPMLLKLAKSALSGKGKGGSKSFLQTAVGRTGRYLRRREQTSATASVLAPSFMQMDMYHHQYQSLAQNHFGEEGGNMATILTEKVPQLLRSVLKDTKA